MNWYRQLDDIAHTIAATLVSQPYMEAEINNYIYALPPVYRRAIWDRINHYITELLERGLGEITVW